MSRRIDREARWTSIKSLIAAGVRGCEGLSPTEKADVYEGIAFIAHSYDADTAAQALTLASSLRDAESLQLHFRNLFSATA